MEGRKNIWRLGSHFGLPSRYPKLNSNDKEYYSMINVLLACFFASVRQWRHVVAIMQGWQSLLQSIGSRYLNELDVAEDRGMASSSLLQYMPTWSTRIWSALISRQFRAYFRKFALLFSTCCMLGASLNSTQVWQAKIFRGIS